ncbi:hypothetical protein GCM10011494_03290 [Novosphingobium endophyticum]|uniref:DUF1214 domain-containing protein n=1 Tax=Novosphingobium endophyticum TaxID=1955250 RepID=A0A916TQK9_9SPHN|nr:hypothetical protein [Novosphingobium endophyticum]GGB88321.1 hypothetical protein GCM10011494_03290 [Novosphingobium endophyticum]
MTGGWEILEAAIAEARALVAAEAPEPAIAAEGEAYVIRVVTAALGTAFMGHRLAQSGLTMALPVHGGPNPDYIMRHAAIDAAGRYRLQGRLNGSERVGVGLYTIGRNGAPLIAAYKAFDHTNCGPDGGFALDIAADAAGPDTLAIPSGARVLMVRVLHRDGSEPAHLDLSGGAPPRGPTLVTGSSERALGFVAGTVRANIAEYMNWVAAARDLPNALAEAPDALAATVIGDVETQYFLGGFDLAKGEWLEIVLPAGLPGYWSLHAYNYWYEHLVTPGVHDRNAVPEADGTIRIAMGPDVPAGASNGIDTLGRRRGALVCRIVGQTSPIAPPITRLRSS